MGIYDIQTIPVKTRMESRNTLNNGTRLAPHLLRNQHLVPILPSRPILSLIPNFQTRLMLLPVLPDIILNLHIMASIAEVIIEAFTECRALRHHDGRRTVDV